MRRFVLGDIHGSCRGLLQCLERAKFDRDKDRLIVLGDVCDGWPDVKNAIDELLKIKKLHYILGNHDVWTLQWALKGVKEDLWLSQGGQGTLESYQGGPMPDEHIRFLKDAPLWRKYKERLFVHAGFDPDKPLKGQSEHVLLWERGFVEAAEKKHQSDPEFRFGEYKDIFVGHTPTLKYQSSQPVRFCNLWILDTGAGWDGPLTIMDIESKEFWQSDPSPKLYPEASGRS